MKPELKAAWITALRSGKYEQGRKALRSKDNHYCCLGVLCDLINPKKWSSKADKDGIYWYLDKRMTGFIPFKELIKIGLEISQANKLVLLNDTKKENFQQIADWIEANL